MKWRNEYGRRIDEYAKRKEGDRKSIRKFALLPKMLHTGDTIWLEYYYDHYRYADWYNDWVLVECTDKDIVWA